MSRRRSISRTDTPEMRRTSSSSVAVKKVLIGVGTAPASAAPNTPDRYSGRFEQITPTRVPLPIPQATSDRAVAIARSHRSA